MAEDPTTIELSRSELRAVAGYAWRAPGRCCRSSKRSVLTISAPEPHDAAQGSRTEPSGPGCSGPRLGRAPSGSGNPDAAGCGQRRRAAAATRPVRRTCTPLPKATQVRHILGSAAHAARAFELAAGDDHRSAPTTSRSCEAWFRPAWSRSCGAIRSPRRAVGGSENCSVNWMRRSADAGVRRLTRPGLERQHRRCDLTGGRLRDRRRGSVEHEQPRTGDLARERLAVADREERIAATMHHQSRDRELGEALAPARLAVERGEHHAQLIGHLRRGLGARGAVPDAFGGRARGVGSFPRISAPPAAHWPRPSGRTSRASGARTAGPSSLRHGRAGRRRPGRARPAGSRRE